MFAIVEGVDCAGKTGLTTALAREMQGLGLTTEVLHRGVPERHPLDEYQLDVELYRPGQTRAVVADRWHWGEPVYGELYRGGGVLGTAGFRYVELFLRSRGAVTVLAEHDAETILRRFAERGEDYLKPEHVRRVIEHYGEIFERSATGVQRVVLDGDVSEVVASVIKHAEFWSGMTAALEPFPTYIGDRTPGLLLLGERRGDQTVPSMTAFRPVNGNSATYLLEALPETLWKSVGLANLFEETDVDELIDVLAGPAVVALGRKVSKELTRRGIAHGAVPHPQAVRRFHNARKVDYGQLIHDVMVSQEDRIGWPRDVTYDI